MPNVIDVTALGSAGFAINGDNQFDSLGVSVSAAGDINGDGFADVVVGAPYGYSWSTGMSYVVFGHAGSLETIDVADLDGSAGFAIQGGAADYSATSVSDAGDINGDGFDDLIIGGAAGYYGSSTGNTYVVYGHASGFGTIDLGNLASSDGFKIEDPVNSGWGNSHAVSAAGDVNGDGVGDIFISSSGNGDYVVFGSKSGFGTIDLSKLDASEGFAIGTSVASTLGFGAAGSGDINGDGYSDLIIPGAPGGAAAAYVIFGHAGSFDAIDVTKLTSSQGFAITASNPGSGRIVASAGDFNGDGLDDVIVGMPYKGATGSDVGSAYIVYGKTDGQTVSLDDLSASDGVVLEGASVTDYAGGAVSGAGDVNHDGYDDVIVGASGVNDGAGNAYVVYGRPTGPAEINLGDLQARDGFVVQGSNGDSLGSSVSGAGDVNGDGYDDVVVGASGTDSGATNAGAAYVILGAPTPLTHITGTDADDTLTGTSADEYIDGLSGNDLIHGRGGNDRLLGREGNDHLDGGAGVDKMYGGGGDDTYIVRDTTDYAYEDAGEGTDEVVSYVNLHLRANIENLTLAGNADIWGYGNELGNRLIGNDGNNKLFGLGGDDVINAKGGTDLLVGGTGNDRYFVDSYSDRVIENVGEGTDTVFATANYKLRANVEKLTLTGSGNLWGYGNDGANVLTGNTGANKLFGMGGDDTLSGGQGNDWLEGGAGRDHMSGGSGQDTFVFYDGDFGGSTHSTSDAIRDFSQGDGDILRLNFVDANTTVSGNQAFDFIGTSAFGGNAGELRYEEFSGNTYVAGDTDGDGQAEFMVRLDGLHTLTSADFVL